MKRANAIRPYGIVDKYSLGSHIHTMILVYPLIPSILVLPKSWSILSSLPSWFKFSKIIPQFYYYDRIFPYLCGIFAKDNNPDLKLFFTYILLVSLTLQSFYRSILTMEYEIHLPDYIANCINKSRPDLHCNGQCVLMQKIRDKEKKESKKNFVVYEYSSHYVHKEFSTLIKPITVEEPVEKPLPIYISEYRFEFSNPLFRPPIA